MSFDFNFVVDFESLMSVFRHHMVKIVSSFHVFPLQYTGNIQLCHQCIFIGGIVGEKKWFLRFVWKVKKQKSKVMQLIQTYRLSERSWPWTSRAATEQTHSSVLCWRYVCQQCSERLVPLVSVRPMRGKLPTLWFSKNPIGESEAVLILYVSAVSVFGISDTL